MAKNIVLTGFMGVGKSTIGRRAAKRLGRRFVDTDEEIEKKFHKTISEIFAQEGETAFRRYEQELVAELAAQNGLIIATGGGVVKSAENRRLLRQNGFLVYLDADVDKIISNVGNTDKRPLLRGKNREQILALMKERAPLYQDHDCRIDTSALGLPQCVDEIIKLDKMLK